MSDTEPTCARCSQRYLGGSHYHCGACATTDTTGMYGHHTVYCQAAKSVRTFHHCGPNGDCELSQENP